MTEKEKEIEEEVSNLVKTLHSVTEYSDETYGAMVMSSIGDKFACSVVGNYLALLANICTAMDGDPRLRELFQTAIKIYDAENKKKEQKPITISAVPASITS